MKKLKCEILFLLVTIFAVCFVQQIFACSCRGIPTPYESFQNSESVFVGKVTGILDSSGKQVIENVVDNFDSRFEGERIYRFKVDEWFKGEKTSEVSVSMNLNMCQFGLKKDEKLLVYANKSGENLSVWTFCSRTRNVEDAKDDVLYLRELLENKPEPRIYGSVKFVDNTTVNPLHLEGIKIVATRGEVKYVTHTDKNGLYRFNKLPNGKYTLLPVLPKKYVIRPYSMSYLQKISLVSDNPFQYEEYGEFSGRHAYSEFQTTWNNQISGKVLDAEGKFVDYASVKLIPADQIKQIDNKPFYKSNSQQSLYRENPQSNIKAYNISAQTPGKYILAVEVFAPFAPNKDSFKIYYPQTTDPRQAKIIEIKEFDRQIIDVKLPEGFIVHYIEGVFIWGSGNPVEDGWISAGKLENTEDEQNISYDVQKTDKGKFKFQLFENVEYWVYAKVYQEKTKPIKLKVGKINKPLKITLWLIKNKE